MTTTAQSPWKPGIRFRVMATTHPMAFGLLAGILATHIATIVGFWFHGIFGLPDLDFPRFNAYLLYKPDGTLADMAAIFAATTSTTRLVIGWLVHMMTGVVFAMTYVVAIHPRLTWRNTSAGNLSKAMIWGAILATISGLWWIPVLFPDFNPGIFGQNFWGLGKGIIAVYLWHFIWAANLALFYNPLNPDEIVGLVE